MASRGGWVFAPDSGGSKIPDRLKPDVEQRIRRCAEEEFAGKYTRLDIRFRGQFCYVDAYCEPVIRPGWPPADGPETPEEYLERLRNTPTHLCRLRHFGPPDHWSFGFFSYASESYQLSVFENGEFFGEPEEAFRLAARVYLVE
jgi:hypothetical protein